MADQDHVIAPHRIVDHELERVVYSTGDKVPMGDAVKYGLIDKAPAKKAAKASKRARKGPAEDRARKKGEDR